MTLRLDGTVALVTGGGRGIGRAVARALAARGSAVAVTARSPDEVAATVDELTATGARALALPADVTDRTAVRGLVDEVQGRWGPVDLLVNNAGRLEAVGPLWDTDPDVWWREVEVNLRGPLLCCSAVVPAMVARGTGRVVNMGSGAGARPGPWSSAYATSKAALLRLTDSLEASLAGTGVHAFLVAPGLVRTALTDRLPAELLPGSAEAGRWRPAERVADLVVALAAGAYDPLAGRFLHVDDDLPALLAALPDVDADARTLRLAPWGDVDPLLP